MKCDFAWGGCCQYSQTIKKNGVWTYWFFGICGCLQNVQDILSSWTILGCGGSRSPSPGWIYLEISRIGCIWHMGFSHLTLKSRRGVWRPLGSNWGRILVILVALWFKTLMICAFCGVGFDGVIWHGILCVCLFAQVWSLQKLSWDKAFFLSQQEKHQIEVVSPKRNILRKPRVNQYSDSLSKHQGIEKFKSTARAVQEETFLLRIFWKTVIHFNF